MKTISEQYKSIIYDIDLRWLKLDINFDDITNLREFKSFDNEFSSQNTTGWSGLSYRGIELKKVRPYPEYGYKSEDEVPYEWTEMASACPNFKTELDINFPECKFYRVKVNKLAPGGKIYPHSDSRKLGLGLTEHSPYSDTNPFKIKYITYALDWPDNVDYYVNKRKLPIQTGDVFLVNFGMVHEVYNLCEKDRVSIIITADLEDQEWWQNLVVRSFALNGQHQPGKADKLPLNVRLMAIIALMKQKISYRLAK